MNMILAILWTFVLVMHIWNMSNGGQPTWFDVFLPLICLVINDWIETAKNPR